VPETCPSFDLQYAAIIHTLEAQLAELDKIGSHIAAAHLDAAIVHLRREVSKEDSTLRHQE